MRIKSKIGLASAENLTILIDKVSMQGLEIALKCKSTLKVTYDPEVDILRILFTNASIEESDEDKPGTVIDYDKAGNIVGMEILNASKRIGNPQKVEYSVVRTENKKKAV